MAGLRAVDPGDESVPDERDDVERLEGTWPHALSHEPHLRVSDVLAQLGGEFPALTPSKLRFLDSNGLVTPERTASGYRQYSPADVERLRFVLRQQRDHFRPLGVISEHLAALDSGRMHEPIGLHEVRDSAAYVTMRGLAEAVGTSDETIATLEHAGVIAQTMPGRYHRGVVPLAVAATAYLDAGGDPRSLKSLVRAATREADLARDAGAARRSRGDDTAADATARLRMDAAVAVFSACVHAQVDR